MSARDLQVVIKADAATAKATLQDQALRAALNILESQQRFQAVPKGSGTGSRLVRKLKGI